MAPPRQGTLAPCHLHPTGSEGVGSRDLGACRPDGLSVGARRGVWGFWGPGRLRAQPKVSQGCCFPAREAEDLVDW